MYVNRGRSVLKLLSAYVYVQTMGYSVKSHVMLKMQLFTPY